MPSPMAVRLAADLRPSLGRVRSPHMAKLQAASVPRERAAARLGLGQTGGRSDRGIA